MARLFIIVQADWQAVLHFEWAVRLPYQHPVRRGLLECFHYLGCCLQCLNEVPAEYAAYRKQQHRWSCGPMQLWRKATNTVWASDISLCQKLYVLAGDVGACADLKK